MLGRISLHNAGRFNILVKENRDIFLKYFGVEIFPGSLNIQTEDKNLPVLLDSGKIKPLIIIPKEELKGMPGYIGDGRAWEIRLCFKRFPEPIRCWVFRRVGSRVPAGMLEIISDWELVKPYGLKHGDTVEMNGLL